MADAKTALKVIFDGKTTSKVVFLFKIQSP
jgi:hypothetical protein